MKKIFIIAILITSLSSCITSLQPLASIDKVTTDNRIIGNWKSNGDTYTITAMSRSGLAKELRTNNEGKTTLNLWEDAATDSIMSRKAYVIEFASEGVTYYMVASLVKLDGQTFVNLYPGAVNNSKRSDDQKDPFIFNADYLPGFTIAKVEITDASTMTLKFIDGDFVSKQLEQGNMKIKHELNSLFGTLLITASTEELQRFVAKYGNDERLFSKNYTFRRSIHEITPVH